MNNKEHEEKRITDKDIADRITEIANRKGDEAQNVWNRWLEWMCEGLDAKYVIDQGLDEALTRMREDNGDYFQLMMMWVELAYREMKRSPGYDAFGTIYENNFKSKGKANGLGQFFTPVNVCRLMAKICGNRSADENGIVCYNDPAIGSGRTLLAAWYEADKYGKNWFEGGDVDATSVRMSALNFMINGMVGCVVCQDALSREWRFGYLVNPCKVPMVNSCVCLQYFDDEVKFNAAKECLYGWMKCWNIGNYRNCEDTPKDAEEPKVVVEEEQEPVQMELGI